MNDTYSSITTFLKDIYLHFRISSKEQYSIRKIGEINNLLITSIPKPFATQLVADIRNTLAAIRTIWTALILTSQKKKQPIIMSTGTILGQNCILLPKAALDDLVFQRKSALLYLCRTLPSNSKVNPGASHQLSATVLLEI